MYPIAPCRNLVDIAFILLDAWLPSNEESTESGAPLEFPLLVLAAVSNYNGAAGDVPLGVIYLLVKSNLHVLFNNSAAVQAGWNDLDLGTTRNRKRKSID